MSKPRKLPEGYRAVIFDLDGTLLDTLEDIATSANAALASLGFPAHETEAYKQLVGEGVDTLARRALPVGKGDPATVDEMVRRYRREYAARWKENSRPYAGVPEMLDGLTGRGIRLAVLSNKRQDYTEMMTAALLPGRPFEVVAGARPGVPIKPDPTAALKIAEICGLPPSAIAFLGDSGIDMETARAAGMCPLGALWGFRDAEELLASGAQALLAHPPDLLYLV